MIPAEVGEANCRVIRKYCTPPYIGYLLADPCPVGMPLLEAKTNDAYLLAMVTCSTLASCFKAVERSIFQQSQQLLLPTTPSSKSPLARTTHQRGALQRDVTYTQRRMLKLLSELVSSSKSAHASNIADFTSSLRMKLMPFAERLVHLSVHISLLGE